VPAEGGYPDDPSPEERWILSRLHEVFVRFDALCEEYRFSDAYSLLYNFAWSEVFDWFLELSKEPLRRERAGSVTQTLGVVLRDLLRLFHPVIPYLTEELWSELVGEGMLAGATWPEPPALEAPGGFPVFQELVVGIRRFRAEHGLAPRHPLQVTLLDSDGVSADWWEAQLESLAGVRPDWARSAPEGGNRTRFVAGPLEVFISLEGIVDTDAERDRLAKAIADAEKGLAQAEKKLSNEQFLERAPEDVVAKERSKAAEFQGRLEKLRAQLAELG
jgi:valyl-tRNA synthetase